jgi:hypothetical protein
MYLLEAMRSCLVVTDEGLLCMDRSELKVLELRMAKLAVHMIIPSTGGLVCPQGYA